MKNLPKLSTGIRRKANGVRPSPGRGAMPAQWELELYGKYCGPGHGDPSGCAPVDEVDAVCCRHDRCYSERGYLDCGCDSDLVFSMPSAIANTESAEGKAWGAAAMTFFSVSPCLCRVCDPVFGFCLPIPTYGTSKLLC